jgi:cyclopropane fatty-acyl-phospholipid synthase-like methyltransferase
MSDGPVISFYDRHPMSEWQILRSLARQGKRPPRLTPEDLFGFDQDHYGGVDAVAALAEQTKIGEESVVLDLCCGLGGPARFLAWRYGCRVTGVDITRDGLATTTDYRQALERAGFSDLSDEDLSADWAQILRARLEMYRGLREETVARFGEEHYQHYDRNYDFFVGLVEVGKLGGARLRAVRPSPDR